MDTLKEKYQQITKLHTRCYSLLQNFVHEAIQQNGGSIFFNVKSKDECDEEEWDYYDQFPASIDVDFKHSIIPIYLTRVSLSDKGLLQVDGFYSGEFEDVWYKNVQARIDYETYYRTAFFISEALEQKYSK